MSAAMGKVGSGKRINLGSLVLIAALGCQLAFWAASRDVVTAHAIVPPARRATR